EGVMNMGLNYGLVQANSAGTVEYNVNKEDPVFHLALGLYFPINEDLLTYMANSVIKGNSGFDPADYTSEHFDKSITEFLPPGQEKVFREQMSKTGKVVSSDQLPYTIFISDVELKWDK